MSDVQSALHQAFLALLTETFDGPPTGDFAFMLNPGDPGLLAQLDTLDADAASRQPAGIRRTIAAHVDHVLYCLALLNRAAAGEDNPWADADWAAHWRATVDAPAWQDLRERLRAAADAWQRNAVTWTRWDAVSAAGVLASLGHTTYHLGAIRQILAAIKP